MALSNSPNQGDTVNVHDLNKEILASDLDYDDVEMIYKTLDLKKKRIARKIAGTLEIGDRIILVNVRPKYLSGLQGVIREFGPNRIEVMLDRKPQGNRYGQILGVKPTMVEKLPA
jgi:hypothetical protein